MNILLFILFCFCVCIIKAKETLLYRLSFLNETANGYRGKIDLIQGSGPYGEDIKELLLEVFFETSGRLHMKISDFRKKRWEVYPEVIRPSTPAKKPENVNYSIKFVEDPFSFEVIRLTDNETIFSTTGLQFVYSNYYIQLGTNFANPNPNLYGFGQRMDDFKLETNGRIYTLWSKDNYGVYAENLYSSHPFYMEQRKGKTHGVFLFNSNAIDVKINSDSMEYRVTGGILDFYFFVGPTPQNVIKEYHDLIGHTTLPPRWSLGFQHSKYGFKNIEEVDYVVRNYEKYQIPIDVIYFDIDHMEEYRSFTWNPVNFSIPKVKELMKHLEETKKVSVVIEDPFIEIKENYLPYTEGVQADVFVRNEKGDYLKNVAWPKGKVHYVDHSHPNSYKYWAKSIFRFLNLTAPYSPKGLWLDMQDPAAFEPCEVTNGNYWNPPYIPGTVPDLNHKTICLTSKHYDTTHYNFHNLYAYFENLNSQRALKEYFHERAFTLVRSAFVGSGKETSHWLGDNFSSWEAYRHSIAMIFEAGFNAIINSGSDICGFIGDTTRELCSRWSMLGAFYPFSRNHNDLNSKGQEPWLLDLTDLYQKYITLRYELLPYLYTQISKSNKEGGMFWKPLWFDYLSDEKTWGIDYQILVGDAIMITPALKDGQRKITFYLPKGNWYDGNDNYKLIEGGKTYTVDAPIDYMPIHFKGGNIVPMQKPAQSTKLQEFNPFKLVVFYDDQGKSEGELHYDSGVDLDLSKFAQIKFNCFDSADSGYCVSSIEYNNYSELSKLYIDKFIVTGISRSTITKVMLNDKAITNFSFANGKLEIFDVKVSMKDAFSLKYQ